MEFCEIRNDTEPNTRYVRVLDPKASEISFVRTACEKKQAFYVSCQNLGSFPVAWIGRCFFYKFILLLLL